MVILSPVVNYGWEFQQLDKKKKKAFLYGELDKEIYMEVHHVMEKVSVNFICISLKGNYTVWNNPSHGLED